MKTALDLESGEAHQKPSTSSNTTLRWCFRLLVAGTCGVVLYHIWQSRSQHPKPTFEEGPQLPVIEEELHKPSMEEELRRLLPYSLLLQAAETTMPLNTSRRLTFTEVTPSTAPDYTPFWPAVIGLSKYGVEKAHAIDFHAAGVLPPPETKDFPKMVLGLMTILDQVPRGLFKGTNLRYSSSYFDPMAVKLGTSFLGNPKMPSQYRPWLKERWIDEMGYSVDQWIYAHMWFMAPFVHSENLMLHDFALAHWSYTRKDIAESNDGLQDPYLKDLRELRKDTFAFAREIQKGPPTKELLGREPVVGDAFYWWDMIFNIHRPIVATYGRYPYRNRQMGRESTEEEKEWLNETDHFGEADKETGKLIRHDVEKGVWRPLNKHP